MMKLLNLRWPTPDGLPPRPILFSALALLVALFATAGSAEINVVRLANSIGRLFEFLLQLLIMPDWSYVPQLAGKMLETLEMTFLATMIALVISFFLGGLAAKNSSPHPVIAHLTRFVLGLIRALPELVWALVFVSAVGLGPLPGVMALALVTVGFMAKFFAESLEVIDIKQVEGVQAHGAGWLQIRTFAMLPQALPDFVGTVMYILDHNLRAAALLGMVGAGGIGYDLVIAMRLFQYDRLLLIVLSIYLIVTLLDRLSEYFRSRLIKGA